MFKKHTLWLHVKSFLASPLNYTLAWQSFLTHKKHADRWADVKNLDDDWDERTALMGRMIAPNSSVFEFGSGKERLKDFLPEGCFYQPSDLFARSKDTFVCDLNANFPPLDRVYDVIVFSGVIEYIHDVQGLLDYVRQYCRECIASYSPTDYLECMTTRLRYDWVNHLPEQAFEAMIMNAGFTVSEKKLWRQQLIYKLI